uniref:Uncharacterized protein n=1 Tax=Knipowitschia caucasica TaxID=637954 RepID=A0AAV2J596_KNICA
MCSARNSKDTAQNPQAPWPLVEDPSLERDNRPRRAKVVQGPRRRYHHLHQYCYSRLISAKFASWIPLRQGFKASAPLSLAHPVSCPRPLAYI